MTEEQKGRLASVNLFSKEEIKREFWRSLPIWFIYIQAIGFLYMMMSHVDPIQFKIYGHPPYLFALTTVLPLFWVVSYAVIRIRESERLVDKTWYLLRIPSILIGIPIAIFLVFTILPVQMTISQTALKHMFEYFQLFWIVLFMIHGLTKRGFSAFVTFFVVGFVYGQVLENTGIIMGYFHEQGYQFYLWRLPAPFATGMGWCMVFYGVIWVAEFFRERFVWFKGTPLRSALLATSIALCYDLQLDPLASLSGVFWEWNHLLKPWFLSVPFINYASWFGAFSAFSWAYFYLQGRGDLTDRQRNWKLFVHISLIASVAGAIWLLIMTVYEGGFDGPTYQILNQFLDKLLPY